MQFYDYMIKKHLGKNTPIGDLAYDMQYERQIFPKNDESDHRVGRLAVRNFLVGKNASDTCLDAFEKAWKSYVRFERS